MTGRLRKLDEDHALKIGHDFSLPLDIETKTTAILGIRGSGKTTTATVIAEELLGSGQQVVVIDPTDGWWGIRSSRDGTAPAFGVAVFGGRHGDLPLNAEDGAMIADLVVDERLSAILSLRHLESQEAMRRVVTDFAKRLYHRKGETGKDTPVLIAIDEAHLFVPQRVGAAEAPMVGAMQRLVRQGRSSGIGVCLIDQRPASVNKDVLTQIELLICHRTTSPQDRNALEAWIEENDSEDLGATFMKRLGTLKPGQAWFWSPGWLGIFQEVAVRMRSTFDSSATPKLGDQRVAPQQLAPIDIERIRERFKEQVEEAEANDPRALRKRIAELEAERENNSGELTDDLIEKFGSLVSAERHLREMIIDIARTMKMLVEADGPVARGSVELPPLPSLSKLADIVSGGAVVGPDSDMSTIGDSVARGASHASTVYPAPGTVYTVVTANAAGGGGSGVRRMLIALAQNQRGLTNRQLGLRAGLSSKSGTFSTYISKLRKDALITDVGDKRVITKAGLALVGKYEKLPTGDALFNYWMNSIGPNSGAARILGALHAAKRPMTNEEIGRKANISHASGTFSTYMSRLRGLELVTGSRGATQISEELCS